MSSFLQRMKSGSHHLQDQPRAGLGHFVVGRVERYAGAGLFGALKGYYREKTLIGGKIPLDALAGGLATALSAGLMIMAGSKGRRSQLAPHMLALGDAGLMSWINSKATAWGTKQSGRQVYVLDAGAKPPGNLPAGMTQVAGLPPMVGGAYLSADEIQHYTAGR